MSDAKTNTGNNNETKIIPSNDINATRVSSPKVSSMTNDISETVFIQTETDDLGATKILAPVDRRQAKTLLNTESTTKVMPPVEIGKTGKMDEIPSSQASSFDILLGRAGIVEGKQFELKKNKLTIGRSPFNDIIIKSASVSASHAELKRGKGCWVLRDIGSVNGISVNGEYGIQGDEFDLSISDQILIGDAVLQLCSPHTIDEISAKPLLLSQARSYKKLYIAVGFITAAVAVVFLLV